MLFYNIAKHRLFYFFAFHIFFYTQLSFVFHFPGDFFIIRELILVFWGLFLQKDFDVFHKKFFESFLCFFIISSWRSFRHFYKYIKKMWRNIKSMLNNGSRLFISYRYYNFFIIFLKIIWQLHKNHIKSVKIFNFFSHHYKDHTIKAVKCWSKKFNRILGVANTRLDSGKRKHKEMMNSFELEKDEKEKITLLKMQKILKY